MNFGEWIVTENWDCLNSEMSPNEQSVMFEQLVNNKLNQFFPEKEIKLSSQDKAFITAELKKIKRQKGREYIKRGKTEKYKRLDNILVQSTTLRQRNKLIKIWMPLNTLTLAKPIVS